MRLKSKLPRGPLIAFVGSLLFPFVLMTVFALQVRRGSRDECRFYLGVLYAAQQRLHEREGRFTERLSELDASIDRGNRYAYFLGTRGPFEVRDSIGEPPTVPGATGVLVDTAEDHEGRMTPSSVSASYAKTLPRLLGEVHPGVSGTCPACELTAVCVGQLDGDATLDVWSISSRERTSPQGPIPAGVAYNDVDDTALLDF